MSLRLEMLQVARLAPRLLGESADSVRAFVEGQLVGGGFADRDGRPDLYYTVFGLDCLAALQAPIPAGVVRPWLAGFGTGDQLDHVHFAALVRAWAAVGEMPDAVRDAVAARGDVPRTDVYETFLALGALQDARREVPRPDALGSYLESACEPDGGFAMAPGKGLANTPTTAAGITMMRLLGRPVPERCGAWLLARALPSGGFVAAPGTPVPDLLSTAVALHALAGMQVPLEGLREPCLDFVDTLWTAQGSFFGHWAETALDCEYTFYGLLALGHLCV